MKKRIKLGIKKKSNSIYVSSEYDIEYSGIICRILV